METGDLACRACTGTQIQWLGRKDGYPFVECARCGFIFIPSLERSTMEPHYCRPAADHDEIPQEGWSGGGTFLQPALERLGNGRGLQILDFGCGESRLPAKLREQGHRAIGVDLMPPARPHPDRLSGDLLELNLDSDRFDLIYSYQVFEHLPEPRPIFAELIRLAAPDGLLLIHTDMDTPQRAGGFFDWFYVMPPRHCSYYRRRTFEVLLEQHAAREEPPAEIVWSDPWSVLIQKAGR